MRPASVLVAIASGFAVVGSACGASHAGPPPAARRAATIEESPAPRVASLAPRLDSDPATYSACAAPSVLRLHAPDDAVDPAVPACAPGDGWAKVPDREQGATVRCDAAGRPGLLARALSGALPLDAVTAAHVRAVFQRGQSQGRRSDAFGLVGDSMTLEGSFMRPFATPRPIAPAAARALALSTGASVIDFFRGASAGGASVPVGSFLAPRAAKVGVRASWPLTPRGANAQSPIEEMVTAVSPAYAVVLYGANDAVFRSDDAVRLRGEFVASLSAIVDALEARGIVPLLTTIPKHMRERGWPDCPASATTGSNERFAVNATILSAAVADLACQRHLPLIDLRWALDPLLNHGVGPDGVHLSVHPSGGAVLDDAGLQCGYDVRNLVTLRELARVVDAADAATPVTPPPATPPAAGAPRVW